MAGENTGALSGVDAAIKRRSNIKVPKERIKDADSPVKGKTTPVISNVSMASDQSHDVESGVKQTLGTNTAAASTTTNATAGVQNSTISQFMTIRHRLKKSVLKRLEQQTEVLEKPKSQTVGLSSQNTTDATIAGQVRALLYGVKSTQADNVVDAKLTADRHKEVMRVAKVQTTALDQIKTFTLTTTARYMEKSLALQYRHVLLAKDTLDVTRAMAETLETKLDAIKVNTGVSEINKRSLVDVTRETMVRNVTTRISGDIINRYSDRAAAALREKFVDPLEAKIRNLYDSEPGKNIRRGINNRVKEFADKHGLTAKNADAFYRKTSAVATTLQDKVTAKLQKVLRIDPSVGQPQSSASPPMGAVYLTFGVSGEVGAVASSDGTQIVDGRQQSAVVGRVQKVLRQGKDLIRTKMLRLTTSGSMFVLVLSGSGEAFTAGQSVVCHGNLSLLKKPVQLWGTLTQGMTRFATSHGVNIAPATMDSLKGILPTIPSQLNIAGGNGSVTDLLYGAPEDAPAQVDVEKDVLRSSMDESVLNRLISGTTPQPLRIDPVHGGNNAPASGEIIYVSYGPSGSVEFVTTETGDELVDPGMRGRIVSRIQASIDNGRSIGRTRDVSLVVASGMFTLTMTMQSRDGSVVTQSVVAHGPTSLLADPKKLWSKLTGGVARIADMAMGYISQTTLEGAQQLLLRSQESNAATAKEFSLKSTSASTLDNLFGQQQRVLYSSTVAEQPYYLRDRYLPSAMSAPEPSAAVDGNATQPAASDMQPTNALLETMHRTLTDWRQKYDQDQTVLLDAVRSVRINVIQGGQLTSDMPPGAIDSVSDQTQSGPGASLLQRAGGRLHKVGGAVNTLFGAPARMLWKGTKALGKMYVGAAKLGMRGTKGTYDFLFDKRARDPFCDVYRKGEIEAGNPLVSAKQLRKGLVLSDNTPIRNVNQIIEPVIDPRTGQTMITADDVKHGLVDVEGNPISKRKSRMNIVDIALGLGKFGIKTAGGVAKAGLGLAKPLVNMYASLFSAAIKGVGAVGSFMSKSIIGILSGKAPGALAKGLVGIAKGITGMYANMFGLGVKGISGIGSMLAGGAKNLFGFGGRGGINRRDVQELITDRLDDIYDLLDIRLGNTTVTAGDTDGDGIRDGSYQDKMRQLAERRAARSAGAEAGAAGPTSKSHSLMGMLSGIGGLLTSKGREKKEQDGEESEGDSGGFWTTLFGTYLATKIPGLKGLGRSAKGVAGKVTGAIARNLPWKRAAAPAMIKTAAKMGGKSLLKKIPIVGAIAGAAFSFDRIWKGDFTGAGAELLSGLVSIVPFFGTGVSTAIDVWLGYRDLNRLEGGRGDFVKDRLKAYGIEEMSLWPVIKELEERTYEIIFDRGNKLDMDDFVNYAGKFGFNVKDKKQLEFWVAWYRARFVKVFMAYVSSLAEYGKKYPDEDEMTEEQVKLAHKKFLATSADIVARTAKVVPTVACFTDVMTGAEKSKEQVKAPQDRGPVMAAPIPPRKAAETPTPSPDPLKVNDQKQTGAAAAAMPKDATSAGQWMNRNIGAAGATAGMIGATAMASAPSGTPGSYAPSNGNNNAAAGLPADGLGGLSAHYESGKKGSAAIGFDGTGGTSYGKYQISSKTMPQFVAWLKAKGGTAAEIATRLANAGPYNTGSRSGGVPTEWQKIVNEGLMGDYEHQFIKATHFDSAFNRLSPKLQERVANSKALQDVLWSTAVQHGSKAVDIFHSVASDQLDDAALIRSIYKKRSTQFGSSTPDVRMSVLRRFYHEEQQALAMANAEKAQNTQLANDNTAGGSPSAGDVNTPPGQTKSSSSGTQMAMASGRGMSAPINEGAAGAQGAPSIPAPMAGIKSSVQANVQVSSQRQAMATAEATAQQFQGKPASPDTPAPTTASQEIAMAIREDNKETRAMLRELIQTTKQQTPTSTTSAQQMGQAPTVAMATPANAMTVNAPVINNTNVAQVNNRDGGFDVSKPRDIRYHA